MSGADYLMARLQALERTVAALAAQAGGGESRSPNYLTMDPTGKVGALFTGGVQMVEETSSTYSPGNALGWLDSAGGGEIREAILGVSGPMAGEHVLDLQSQADPSDVAQLILISDVAGAAGSAQAIVSVQDHSGANQSVKIIDSAGNSSFAFASSSGAGVNITAPPYNAKGDITEAFLSITSGIATVTNNTLNFTTADNGKTIVINDFPNGLAYLGTLSGITGSQATATIAPSPAVTLTNKRGCYGTDNTSAFQTAINNIAAANPDFGNGGGTIIVPGFISGAGTPVANGPGIFGKYLFASTLDFTNVQGLMVRGEGNGGQGGLPELRFVFGGTQACLRMHSCAGVLIENLNVSIQNTGYFGDMIDFDHTSVGSPFDPTHNHIDRCTISVFNAGSPRSLIRMNNTIFCTVRNCGLLFGYTPILWGGDHIDSQGTNVGYVNVCKLENCTSNDSLLAHVYIDTGDCEECVIDQHGFENMNNAGVLGSSRCVLNHLQIRNPWMGDVGNAGGIWFRGLYCGVAGSRIAGGFLGNPGPPGGYTQTISQAGAATSTWSLALTGGFGGPDTASGIPANATALQIQNALQGLAHVGPSGVTCTGGPLGTAPVVCTFSIAYNANLINGVPVGLQGLNTMTVPTQPTGATVSVAGTGGANLQLGGAMWDIDGVSFSGGGALFDMTPLSGPEALSVHLAGCTLSAGSIFQNGSPPSAGSVGFHDNFIVATTAYLPPTIDRRTNLKTVPPGAYTFNVLDLEQVLQNTANGVNVVYTIPTAANFFTGSGYSSGSAPPNQGQKISLLQNGGGTITLAGAGGVTLVGGTLATVNSGDRLFAEYLGADKWSVYYSA